MAEPKNFIEEIGELVRDLNKLGFNPILVGGMALVTLGSRRVTRDFDFVISKPEQDFENLLRSFYKRGLELAAKLNKNGEIISTIDNLKVATIRLKLDSPASVYFLNPKTGLRIDLLFDFPLAAAELVENAKKTKIKSYVFYIASKQDLIRLKEIAISERSMPGDEQDLAFLKSLI